MKTIITKMLPMALGLGMSISSDLVFSMDAFVKRIVQPGNFRQFIQEHNNFQLNSNANKFLPVAQGTFLKDASGKIKTISPEMQYELLLAGAMIANNEGRPFIIDTANVYNEFYNAGAGIKKYLEAASTFQHNSPFLMMKFNEIAATGDTKAVGLDISKEMINQTHFNAVYNKNKEQMGIENFTAIMPHGQFLKDFDLFLDLLEKAGVDKKLTAVGVSNYHSLAALEDAYQKSTNRGWNFLMFEVEDSILCHFPEVEIFNREHPEIYSFIIGANGGKQKAAGQANFELVPQGVDKMTIPTIPSLIDKLRSDTIFSNFTTTEIAYNIPAQRFPKPVIVFGTISPERVRQNYHIPRIEMTKERKELINRITPQGLFVRYSIGVRNHIKDLYQLQ